MRPPCQRQDAFAVTQLPNLCQESASAHLFFGMRSDHPRHRGGEFGEHLGARATTTIHEVRDGAGRKPRLPRQLPHPEGFARLENCTSPSFQSICWHAETRLHLGVRAKGNLLLPVVRLFTDVLLVQRENLPSAR